MNVTSPQAGSRSNPLILTPSQVASRCNEIERGLAKVETRDQLISQAGAMLRANSASFCTRIILNDQKDLEPTLEIIATEFSPPPVHLQKWALITAIKASDSGQPIVETAVDQMGFQVHMVGVLLSKTDSSAEFIATLFSQGSDNAVFEVMLLNSVRNAIADWDASQENKEFVRLAQDTAALVDLRSRIEGAQTVAECFDQIVNELSHYVRQVEGENCGESSVFAARVDQGQAQLAAMSNSDALPQDSAIVEALDSAFGECVCRNEVTSWPVDETANRHATLCHQRLSQILKKPCLQSVLLHDSMGNVFGVVTLATENPVHDRVNLMLATAAQPLGATLELVHRAEQNHLQKMINRTRESFKTEKTKIMLRCLVGLVLLGLIPMPYRVATDCEMQPTERRYVCAPFSSQLGQCQVEPGDIVSKDQVLATLDEREIRMELAEVEAEFHRASKKRDGHVAAHESGEASLANLEADGLRARNELLTHRAENLRLKSPIEGMVIEGDHEDNLGMPLETGQSLFQIAPLGELNVELFVPDADIRYVKSGMPATIRLEAFPFESWNGTIERIQPAAEIRNDDSVFVATVNIQNLDGRLRPGMTGSAKISSVWRPIAWNWLHQPVARCLRWIGW